MVFSLGRSKVLGFLRLSSYSCCLTGADVVNVRRNRPAAQESVGRLDALLVVALATAFERESRKAIVAPG